MSKQLIPIFTLGVVLWSGWVFAQTNISNSNTDILECQARVLLVVNDEVITREFRYNRSSGEETRIERVARDTASSYASSYLTQFFLASPMAIFEAGHILRELLGRSNPQTEEQFVTLLTTVATDFIVTTEVDVNTSPHQLQNGGYLYDAQATIFLTVYQATSGAEIIAEERLIGRSRLQYPSSARAEQEAVEEAFFQLISNDDTFTRDNVFSSPLMTHMCEIPPQLSIAMEIRISALSDFEEADSVYLAIEDNFENITLKEFSFNQGSAIYMIEVPDEVSSRDVVNVLRSMDNLRLRTIQVQSGFLEFEAE